VFTWFHSAVVFQLTAQTLMPQFSRSVCVFLSGGSHTGSVPVVDLLHQQCVPIRRHVCVGAVYQQCVSLHAGFH